MILDQFVLASKLNMFNQTMEVMMEEPREEWVQLRTPREEVPDEEDEAERILRGPVWNYASWISRDQLLFGDTRRPPLAQAERVLRGAWWSPTNDRSLAQYMLQHIRGADQTATALVEADTGRSLTYEELLRHVVRLAAGLRHIGVLPGHVFSVVSFNSLEAQTIVLAILMVGGITSVVDPALNPVDLGANMRLSRPRWVFSESGSTLEKVETALGYLMIPLPPTLVVNSRCPLERHHTFTELLLEYDPQFKPQHERYVGDNAVFLLFTSGTTGVNKATLVSERYFMRSKMFMESVFVAAGPKYTTLLSCPLFWISIMATFLVHITNGHRVVLMRGPPTPATLVSVLRKYNVMLWVTTPSALMQLLHWPARVRCPRLRIIIPIGMTFRRENIIRVRDEAFEGKVEICQMYGLTELGLVTGNMPKMNKIGSVGKPFPNVQMKVVETTTGLYLGPYEEGELCFKSPSMMLGYYQNPTETANVVDQDGFIHTGDIGHYDDEGFVFLCGRIKELIKWRSYNILPLDIELMLTSQPEVQEAVVFGVFNEDDGDIVTAAIVPMPGFEDIDPTIIETRVNNMLSFSRRIRGGVHVFATFPRGSTGKPFKRSILAQVIRRSSN